MPEFHTTPMGMRFIEGTIPSIMHSLDRIANALEKMNEEPRGDLLINEITKVSPEVQEALKGITNSQVLKFLKDVGPISNIREWRYISDMMRIANEGEIISLVNIFFGEEVANKFFDYITPKAATDDTN